jgi:hypothetical protein
VALGLASYRRHLETGESSLTRRAYHRVIHVAISPDFVSATRAPGDLAFAVKSTIMTMA